VAELAVTDGRPPPSGLPDGECIITRIDDPVHGPKLHIDHADPRVLISAELLSEAFIAPVPGVSLSPEYPGGHGYGIGALLKICGINRTVIYRITGYVPRVHGYIGEWPD